MSVFLDKPRSSWTGENDLAFAIRDGFPVSQGHTLVIPKRVVPTWGEATGAEKIALMDLVEQVRGQLQTEFEPDGFNIGINVGEAAGQTVMHLHIHVIPRWHGDVDDPRGGVRFVIPEKGNYRRPGHIPRRAPTPALSRGEDDTFLAHLSPLIGRADHIDIVAAFVLRTGLMTVRARLDSALARGARIRVLTGDYLNFTQADALRDLLDLSFQVDGLAVRVIEVDRLEGSRSFHPKAWILSGRDLATAFVGSSNLSRTALTDGVEWNLKTVEPAALDQINHAFELLWDRATVIDQEWLAAYAERAARTQRALPIDVVPESTGSPPQPRDVQEEALVRLAEVRAQGRDRALVVLATGLGKTWLAAFDVDRVRLKQGRVPRTLVVAHRRELLTQAARTFRGLFPRERFGWFLERHQDREGDFVFASVQKLRLGLDQFSPDAFDYIVIDEAHHAAADSYRLLFDHFKPGFWLGLTATPERADSRSIFGLFHDEVAYEADIGVGIALGHLVPFAYFGLADPTDFTPIPWRNGRFDAVELAKAVQTQVRMERVWQAFQEHPGKRSLVFCCTIDHADFARDWLAGRGLKVVAVHSGQGSADRSDALEALGQGTLDAICTVDLFNEGIDLPMVDRVVMLRPTESSVIFLQQMGRGLRTAEGKERLLVIDFVGNHRVFLDRVRTLLNLVGGDETRSVGGLTSGPVALPSGCSVDIDLEAVELLKKLLPSGQGHALVRTYRELKSAWGRRPMAGELSRMGLNPGATALRRAHDNWLGFVCEESDLTKEEERVYSRHRDWFSHLGRTPMTKSFKMVTIQALMERGRLTEGMALEDLALASHELLLRSESLRRDIEGVKALATPLTPGLAAWARYWRDNPIRAWAGGPHFRFSDGMFSLARSVEVEDRAVFRDLTRELVDWRLHAYRRRKGGELIGGAFSCKVLTNQRDPILKLPDRGRFPDTPSGETDVQLPDGSWWRFRFVKLFVNVARPVGTDRNSLADLMREWFGPSAGSPGTAHRVRFAPTTEGWRIEPLESANTVVYPTFGRVTAYPSLAIAAGFHPALVGEENVDVEQVFLPRQSGPGEWASRAKGHSMDGGKEPIRDGDWVVFNWSRSAGLSDVESRIVCVQRGQFPDATMHLKRVVRRQGQFWLWSENLEHPSELATEEDVPIATRRQVIRPEQMAPERLAEGPLQELFGWVDAEGGSGAVRHGGHLFVLLDVAGQAVEPTQVVLSVPDWRPSETAFVCHRSGDGWRYLGVGRTANGRDWVIPEMDFLAWSVLRREGASGGLSRALPPEAEEVARAFVASMPVGARRSRDGKEVQVLGKGVRGGLKLRSGQWKNERSVSLADIGWVLVARDGLPPGGVLDEASVNRSRYIEGTPRASTRWVDTGNALVLVIGT